MTNKKNNIEQQVCGIRDPVQRDLMRRCLYRLDALEVRDKDKGRKLSALGEWHEGDKRRWFAKNRGGKIRYYERTFSEDMGVSEAIEG